MAKDIVDPTEGVTSIVNDDLYSGVVGASELFPAGTAPKPEVQAIVDEEARTRAEFVPAAKIIDAIVSREKDSIYDLRQFLKELPDAKVRTESEIKDEIRARELYDRFLTALGKTINAALAEITGGQHET